MSNNRQVINILGAGLAGLSAAKTLAEASVEVRLFSVQPSERAQSNLAEGGINACLDVMGEQDTLKEHFEDTMRGGCDLADPVMVKGLVQAAPWIVRMMDGLGVPFHRENGQLVQRNFGGQKKKRTTYAKSSTGKVLTLALINEVRKHEAEGRVKRYSHHRFERLILDGTHCTGLQVYDLHEKKSLCFDGPVIAASGGLNGMFPGLTTGTTANTGSAAAVLFTQGVRFANLEFIQYHPTTSPIAGKRMLISEAARGEGGRLFYRKDDGSACYFMEEQFGERGNLMPRDVISREMARLGHDVWLDLTGLSAETWAKKLSDLRQEIIHYMALDPAKEPVPVSPGIHYFMGGISVDPGHRTNMKRLYAAGECAAAYHGANRLGGNSLLGAIYGGMTAAGSALADLRADLPESGQNGIPEGQSPEMQPFSYIAEDEKKAELCMEKALREGLGIIRSEETMLKAVKELAAIRGDARSDEMTARLNLAEAMLMSALYREESRGAHTRSDFPETKEAFRRTTIAEFRDGAVRIIAVDNNL